MGVRASDGLRPEGALTHITNAGLGSQSVRAIRPFVSFVIQIQNCY